jgi:Ras-related protein Rab-6A
MSSEASYAKAADEIKSSAKDTKAAAFRRAASTSTIGGRHLRRDSAAGLANSNLKNKFKVVVLGDVMVGKTSFIARFLYGNFSSQYQATIGIDFLSTSISLPDRTIRLQIWDTAGQERFRSLIPSYIRDCAVAFVLYDVSERSTFDHVSEWISRIKNEGGDRVVIIVCGNKCELGDDFRAVSAAEGEALAKEHGALFYETSAKSGENIKVAFNRAANELPQNESSASSSSLAGTMTEATVVLLKGTVTPLEKDAGSCAC